MEASGSTYQLGFLNVPLTVIAQVVAVILVWFCQAAYPLIILDTIKSLRYKGWQRTGAFRTDSEEGGRGAGGTTFRCFTLAALVLAHPIRMVHIIKCFLNCFKCVFPSGFLPHLACSPWVWDLPHSGEHVEGWNRKLMFFCFSGILPETVCMASRAHS